MALRYASVVTLCDSKAQRDKEYDILNRMLEARSHHEAHLYHVGGPAV